MAFQAPGFQHFTHPCMEPECRARDGHISYGLSKARPTVLEKSIATCLRCGAGYSLRLGAPEATGVRVHIKLLAQSFQ